MSEDQKFKVILSYYVVNSWMADVTLCEILSQTTATEQAATTTRQQKHSISKRVSTLQGPVDIFR